jgi:hypothetical protein
VARRCVTAPPGPLGGLILARVCMLLLSSVNRELICFRPSNPLCAPLCVSGSRSVVLRVVQAFQPIACSSLRVGARALVLRVVQAFQPIVFSSLRVGVGAGSCDRRRQRSSSGGALFRATPIASIPWGHPVHAGAIDVPSPPCAIVLFPMEDDASMSHSDGV